MPNTASAIRKVRRVAKQTIVNRLRKSRYRAAIKKMEELIKVGKKEYNYKVKEGQLITFPAHLLHGSMSNGDLRKTVISFNSNFKYYVL